MARGRIPLIPADLRRKHALMGEASVPVLCARRFSAGRRSGPCCARMRKPRPRCWPSAICTSKISEHGAIWMAGWSGASTISTKPNGCPHLRLGAPRGQRAPGHLRRAPAHDAARSRARRFSRDTVRALRAGGRPFVLAEDHPALRHMAVERLKDPQPFWHKLEALPELKSMPPSGRGERPAQDAARSRSARMRLSHRVAGLGSLGRQTFRCAREFEGGLIAREAKQLTDSAWLWAWPPPKSPAQVQESIIRKRWIDPSAATILL